MTHTIVTVVTLHQRMQAAGLLLPLAHVSPELRKGFYEFQAAYATCPPASEPPKRPMGFSYNERTR